MQYKNIGFVASEVKNTTFEENYLLKQGCIKIENVSDLKKHKIDLLFVLGGDGFMLRTFHKYLNRKIDFYGINCGTQGFLLNNYKNKFANKVKIEDLINNATKYTINPLKATITNIKGAKKTAYAINEITLLRSTHNASHIKIKIDDTERLAKLTADGVIVATPAGSTAYNLSLNGSILPLDSKLVVITPISPFSPRLWKGAIIKNNKKIEFDVLNSDFRMMYTTADFMEFRNTAKIEIVTDFTKTINILFDNDETIEEKIMNQQFYSN